MFGIENSELDLISQVVKSIDPSEQMYKMGSWGIIHLVCGALYSQTLTGMSSTLECLPNQNEIIINYVTKSYNDEEMAVVFSNYIEKWAKDTCSQALANTRLKQLFKKKAKDISDKSYICYKEYLTLAIMLNSLEDLSCFDNLNEVKEWAKNNKHGWEKLFFGAGLLLGRGNGILWQDYESCIKSFAGIHKKEVDQLFEHFRNSE